MPSDVRQMLMLCGDGQQAAWALLWQIIGETCNQRLNHALRRAGMDQQFAEDVLQDFYLYLDRTRLHCLVDVFAGTSQAQLRAFLRVVVARFAQREIRRWTKQDVYWSDAVRQIGTARRDGPDENQIERWLCQLADRMPEGDRRKFRVVAASSPMLAATAFAKAAAPGPRPARTVRRWRRELLRQYGDALLDVAGLG